ncbi:MAG: DEAD/DEAH box helicase family protein [Candidatus Korarchaeota archaeon]
MNLSYKDGTLIFDGAVKIPGFLYHPQSETWRAPGYIYREAINFLKREGIVIVDNVFEAVPFPEIKQPVSHLREYQREALEKWLKEEWGIIELPTGAGKTHIALHAIYKLKVPTLIVVPTLDLLEQWRENIGKELGIDPGWAHSGRERIDAVTVTTYDTAYRKAGYFGNKFKFLVFDEVHHLAAEGYIQIAEMMPAPWRMGLTATYERPDNRHIELSRVMGNVVYKVPLKGLQKKGYLAEYQINTITVDLTPEEREEYDKALNEYKSYIREKMINMTSPEGIRLLVMLSAQDINARKALLARQRAREIAFNSDSKLNAVKEILEKHPDRKAIIFTEYNEMANKIGRKFLIPIITHETPENERQDILNNFRSGKYKVIVTSKVLNEGIDVPDASLGIIVCGSGSKREFIQRLGRLLRPKETHAILYEIVSKKTSEIFILERRREIE